MPSTDPIPTPPTPNSSWINTFWQQNQIVLDRILITIIVAVISAVFHVNLSDTQQAIHDVKDVQAKNVAVEVRGNATDVQALKDVVLTQPATQPSK